MNQMNSKILSFVPSETQTERFNNKLTIEFYILIKYLNKNIEHLSDICSKR